MTSLLALPGTSRSRGTGDGAGVEQRLHTGFGHELIQGDLHEVDVEGRPAPGPQVGQLGEELYIAQLEGHLHTKAQAKKWARDWLARHAEAD